MRKSLQKFAIMGLLLVLLALPLWTVLAQDEEPAAEDTATEVVPEEETTEATPQNLPGLDTLMFLLGAGAIVVVGGAVLARDSFREEGGAA
ncbi:MAG: hypothetical protein K8L99_30050 [Anaerolineae bacterium]|nr:hypothetical protein [Anaerolineae bacterium]